MEDGLDDLRLQRGGRTSEIIEIDIEPAIDRLMDLMIAIAQLTRSDAFLKRPGLACGPILIRSAYVHRLIAPAAAETREDVSGEYLGKVTQMRYVIDIRQRRGDKSLLHDATIPPEGHLPQYPRCFEYSMESYIIQHGGMNDEK